MNFTQILSKLFATPRFWVIVALIAATSWFATMHTPHAKLDRSEPSMKRRAPKSDVPAELESAIVKGLLADRRERYMNAAEFREALSAAQVGE